MTLDADDIEAVAARVVELLRETQPAPARYVDAATLARTLGVERDWVYARARQLGAVRLGDGPKARLRFDLEQARAASRGIERARPAPPGRAAAAPARAPAQAGVADRACELIQGRAGP